MKLPRYESHIAPEPAAPPKVNPDIAGMLGGELERAGSRLANDFLAVQARVDAMNREIELSSSVADAQKKLTDAQMSMLEDPEFNTKPGQFVGKWDEAVNSVRKSYQFKDRITQAKFDESMNRFALAHGVDVRHAIMKKQNDLGVASLMDALDKHEQNAVRAGNPLAMNESMKNGEEAIDSAVSHGIISAEKGVALKQKLKSGISGTIAMQDVQNDPYGAEGRIAGRKGIYQHLDDDKAIRFIDLARTRQEHLKSDAERLERKAEVEANRKARTLMSRSGDALASIAEFGNEGPVDIESGLRGIGTEEAIRMADEYAASKKTNLAVYAVVNKYPDLPFMEQMEKVQQDFAVQPGEEGAKEKIQARDMAMSVVRNRQKRFMDDPSGYAASILKPEEGETPERYAYRSMTLQRELSAGVRHFEPRVLPKDEAKQLGERFQKMDSTAKLEIVRGLSEYGQYANQVMAEAGIGKVAQFALEVDQADPRNSIHARTLIEAAHMKESDIPGDPKAKTKLKQNLIEKLPGNDVWLGITKVLEMQPNNRKLMEYVREMQDGLTNMAMMTGDVGKTLQILDNTYLPVAEDGLGYLVLPRQTTLTESQVKDQLRKARVRGAEAMGWEKPYLGDELFNERVSDLKSKGTWVNAPDGKGYVLIHPGTGKPIGDSNGNPFRLTLDDIVSGHDRDEAERSRQKPDWSIMPMGLDQMSKLEPGFENAVKFVLGEEGGYADVPGDRGGETNFGISHVAYPDLDIKNLTRDQAVAIYKKDYWEKSGADEIPDPKLAMIHFDTAVNMGVSAARNMLEASDGDVKRYMELRRERYASIIKRNPSQKKFERGWANRMERLESLTA